MKKQAADHTAALKALGDAHAAALKGLASKGAEADKLAKYSDIVFVCGRYEGIDSRVKKILKAEEVSVGDYVLTGGELPALSIIDSVSRQIPGVLGTFESLEEERVSSGEMYTRPDVLIYKGKKHAVPKVLLGGHHKEIEAWRLTQ